MHILQRFALPIIKGNGNNRHRMKRKFTIYGIIAIVVLLGFCLMLYLSNNANSYAYAKGKIIGVEGAQETAALQKAKEYDISWLRYDIRLNKTYEAMLGNLSKNGFEILGILDYDTLNVSIKNGRCAENCNWSLEDWANVVSNAIAAYPYISIWEIWNEPQISMFDSGLLDNGSPYGYYEIAKTAYQIIKRHNPNATVICFGGDSLVGTDAAYAADYFIWAKYAWSYGLSNYCDAISLHAYSVPYLLNYSTQNGSIESQYSYWISKYENLTNKPIWITETGMPSSSNESYASIFNLSAEKQYAYAKQALAFFLSKPYVKAVFWFSLYGTANPPYDLDYGLLYSNMTPKPALYAYAAFENASK